MAGETVTVVRLVGGGEDDYGDPLPATEVRTPVDGVSVAPLKQGEDATVDGATMLAGYTLYMPPGSDVVASDTVEVRGLAYPVAGVPGSWVSPHGSPVGGLEVVVRRA